MSDAIFPTLPGLEWGTTIAPQFKTQILRSTSGKEYRSARMGSPVYRIDLSYELLRSGAQAELQQLVGFFLARRGSFDSFLLELPADKAVTQQLLGAGNGITNQFRLVRSFGGTFAEPVAFPIAVTDVRVGGVAVGPGVSSLAGSMLSFLSPPAAGAEVRANLRYWYRARFADDEASFKNFLDRLWSAKKISLVASLGGKV